MYKWFKQMLKEVELTKEIKRQEEFLNDEEIFLKESEREKI